MKKARAGDVESQYLLSRCYSLGKGILEDKAKALYWELQAADQGHAWAQCHLGYRLESGLLMPDGRAQKVQAAKWLSLSAKNGRENAGDMLRYLHNEMKPEQIAEAQKLADEWKPVPPQILGPPAGGKMQTWVSADGRSLSAEWVRLDGNVVILKRADGQIINVPLNKLSAESQAAAKNPPSGTPGPGDIEDELNIGDGNGEAARFDLPTGIARDRDGNLYISDRGHHTIRKMTPAGEVTTLAGRIGLLGYNDAAGSAARFETPYQLAIAPSGDLYVVDLRSTLRKISSTGVVTTVAGKDSVTGSADGTGEAALFFKPQGVAVDKNGIIYVADTYNHTIRKVSPTGTVITFAGTPGKRGSENGLGPAARFRAPKGLAVDGYGNVFVADTGNHTIRKITPAGAVTTLAGTAGNFISKDGTGPTAVFHAPTGMTVDGAGNVYVTDADSGLIRKITTGGVVTTVAPLPAQSGHADAKGPQGKGSQKKASQAKPYQVPGPQVRFAQPQGITVDSAGNLYVADAVNFVIRKVTKDGTVTTIAGKHP